MNCDPEKDTTHTSVMALTYIRRKLTHAHWKALATGIVWKGLYQILSMPNVKNYCPKLDFEENCDARVI